MQIGQRLGQRPQAAAHPKELPPCRGPKLQAFRHHDSPIEWLERLDTGSGSSLDDYGSDCQGYVFKVRIESELYALKVFKFYNVEDTRWYWEAYVSGDNPERLAELHLDPFYAECRAYGRINMAKRQGKIKRDIAVPCYGFIYLDDCYRKQLYEYGVDLDEGCLDSDSSASSSPTPGARRPATSRPIRSIVKKLASSDPGITYKTIKDIRKDILDLNRLEVYNTDVRKHNFCDGKLVDFGSSITTPHCFITPENSLLSEQSQDGDMGMLEDIVDKEGILVSWRTSENLEYRRKLRSSSARNR